MDESSSLVSARMTLGLGALSLALILILGWVVQVAVADPYGLRAASPISSESVGALEPLYGGVGMPDGAVAWSPDGSELALTGGFRSDLVILDPFTGRTLRSWAIPGNPHAIDWSPDGRLIAVGADRGSPDGPGWVFVYSDRGALVHLWKAHNRSLGDLAWSPQGDRLLTTANVEFALWQSGGWREVHRDTHASTLGWSVTWSPEGDRIALGTIGGPAIYDASTGDLLSVFNPGPDYGFGDFATVVWSPDGEFIAAGLADGRLRLFDSDGELHTELVALDQGGTTFGTVCAWSPDGEAVALASSSGIALVSVGEASVVRTLVFPDAPQLDRVVAWSPAGNVLVSTATATHPSLRVWGVRSSPLVLPLASLGAVLALGLTLLSGRSLYHLLLQPEAQVHRWLDEDSALSDGKALFAIALVASWADSLAGHAIHRAYALQPMPPIDWFIITGILSALFIVLPAVVAVKAFHGATWPEGGPRPYRARRYRVFGLILLPFLWTLGLALVLVAVLLLAGVVPSPTAPLAVSGAGVLVGLGFYAAGRTLQGFSEIQPWRAWWGLLTSGLASLAAFFGLAFLLFFALILLRIPSPNEFGFQLLFGFGFVPFLAVVAVLATGGLALGWPSFARLVLPFFSRLRGEAVLRSANRKALMELIEVEPGIHFRELLRRTKVGIGTLHYHLAVLEREGFVESRRENRKRRLFPLTRG